MACSLGGVSIWTMHFVAMGSVTMFNPNDGTQLEVRYRYDYTLISLVVVIFLCYVGLLIGSHDRAFTKDKSDAVDKFIKDARALSIAEIRKIKNVRTVLLSNLLNGVEKLVLAGVIAAFFRRMLRAMPRPMCPTPTNPTRILLAGALGPKECHNPQSHTTRRYERAEEIKSLLEGEPFYLEIKDYSYKETE
jgi:hypothetical protein